MAREGKCEKGGEWEDEDTGWEEMMVWMLNGGDMICQCKCTEDGEFFAIISMGSHMIFCHGLHTQEKIVRGKC